METEEALKKVTPYLWKVAGNYGSFHNREDLLQEGLVGAWKAIDKYDSSRYISLLQHLKNMGAYAIKKCVDRKFKFTGSADLRGHIKVDAALYPDLASFQDECLGMRTYFGAPLHSDNIINQHPEVIEAVRTEPAVAREKIFRGFWLEEPNVIQGGWWYGERGAKRRLAAKLAHLRGSV